MRKHIFMLSLLATITLVGCGGKPAEASVDSKEEVPSSAEVAPSEQPSEAPVSSEEKPASSAETPLPIPTDLPSNGIGLPQGEEVKFEAENAIPTAWKNSGWGSDATFTANDAEANASGGAFVTPSTGNVDSNRKFEIVIFAPVSGKVNMKVAYCRGGKNSKTATIDYSYVYQYKLDDQTGKFTCKTADPTDSSVASWDWRLIEFEFDVTQGQHTIAGFLDSNNASTNAGCPCIDYYLFKLA